MFLKLAPLSDTQHRMLTSTGPVAMTRSLARVVRAALVASSQYRHSSAFLVVPTCANETSSVSPIFCQTMQGSGRPGKAALR